jgi:hypothetical protein
MFLLDRSREDQNYHALFGVSDERVFSPTSHSHDIFFLIPSNEYLGMPPADKRSVYYSI